MNNAEKSGALIVICGIDGSGKTLQSRRLHGNLKERGAAARYVEFPRYSEGFFGALIASYLRGELAGGTNAVSPYLASLPFACDRWEFSGTIRRWLDRGETVVCNRYVSANMAHQGGKIKNKSERESFFAWVERMEYGVFAVPEPRMHLWLDILPEHAMKLIARKERRDYLKDGSDIHENLSHLEKARHAYNELAQRGPDWKRIECSGRTGPKPAGEVAAMIWEYVKASLQIPED